jgi:hypothetical protein
MAIESPHTIISVTLLATGKLIMATEKRMYELINDVWTPMKFADEQPPHVPTAAQPYAPPVPGAPPPTGAPVQGSIFAPPSKV